MNSLLEFDSYARAQSDKHARMDDRFNRGGGIWNMAPEELDEHVIQGTAFKYGVPFKRGNDNYCFAKGSLDKSLASRSVIAFQLDHNPLLQFGTTDDALSVYDDDVGFVFALNLAKAPRGEILARLIEKDNRSSISIGCDLIKIRDDVIDGEPVKVIEEAHVRELSLVREGLVAAAFACVMDKASLPPSLAQPSSHFKAYASLHAVKVNLQKMQRSFASHTAAPPAPRRAYTLADSNRWDSERHERLASAARARQW